MTRNLSENALKHKREYDKKYLKENYSQFRATIKKEELKDIDKTLKDNEYNRTQFIKTCIRLLKEGKIKRD